MYDVYNNHGSTPTTPSTPTSVVRFDKGYIKTLPGILKIVQLLSNLIAFICIKVSLSAWVSAIFYNLLYWFGILITGFLLLCYIFHIVEKYDRMPWLKLEFFYCDAMVVAYVVTSIIAATIGENAGYAVGFFGLVATIAYGMDAYLKYKAWKRGLPPQ